MKINIKDTVEVIKIDIVKDPNVRTANKEEWEPGGRNDGLTPHIGYRNEGKVLVTPMPGESFVVLREKREGIPAIGYFQTSVVKEVIDTDYGCDIHTENSVYQVKLLNWEK